MRRRAAGDPAPARHLLVAEVKRASAAPTAAYLPPAASAGYKSSMSETEPSMLRDPAEGPGPTPPRPPSDVMREPPRPLARQVPVVHVVGFWKRAVAAAIDLAAVLPFAMLVVLVAGKLAGVALPHRIGLFDLDMWIDLVLATDPALVMAVTLTGGIGLVYLLVCHILLGRTLGMRVLKLRIIDVYGDRPSPPRCVARCAGYVAGAATLFLGFLWMGFDSEKRGLQDWIAGTYVIRA
jgi:uncharacterized RDD family membrane protein YckC